MSVTDRLQCDVPADWVNDFSQCLFEWQSLEGGLLALSAALVSICFLQKQIRQTAALHKADLLRRHRAQRAILSLTLSQICQSALGAIKSLAEIRAQPEIGRVLQKPNAPAFELSDRMVAPIQSFLESTTDDQLVGIVTELVTRIQVTRSRLEDMRIDRDHDVDARLLDLGQIHALAECLFDYARFEAEKPPESVGWDRVTAALRIAGVWQELYPDVHKLIEKYAVGKPNFWCLDVR